MKMNKVLLMAMAGVCWHAALAAESKTNATVRTTVNLMDGSRLVGELSLKEIPIQSEAVGKIAIPVAKVQSVRFDDKTRMATVILGNRDKIQGEVSVAELKLRTLLGELRVPVRLVSSVENRGEGVALPGLVLHYSFDRANGDEVMDDTGHDRTGKIHRGSISPEGKRGSALVLEGEKATLTFSDKDLPAGNAARTMAVWLKTPAQPLRQMIFFCGGQVPEDGCYLLIWENTAPVMLGRWGGGDTKGSASVADGQWHQVALVHDGEQTTRVYVDGRLDIILAQQYKTTSPGTGSLSYDFPQHGFRGKLDEFMIFDRALSAEEIKQLYDSQN